MNKKMSKKNTSIDKYVMLLMLMFVVVVVVVVVVFVAVLVINSDRYATTAIDTFTATTTDGDSGCNYY